jgi:hypothetical protein
VRFAALLVLLAVACNGGQGHAPTARIALDPAFVPLADDYHTDVHLDGSGSDDALDDPTGKVPLAFHWDIDDPHPMVTDGSLDAAKVTVRIAAARPTGARLTVTDQSGDSGVATVEIGVTIPLDAGN